MANYFSLSRKSNPTEPVKLIEIDEEVCKYFNQPVHPEKYFMYWYETIGLKLAMGKSFDEIVKEANDLIKNNPDDAQYTENYLKMCEWFRDNFVNDAWATIGHPR